VRVEGTFEVVSFQSARLEPAPPDVPTALPVGVTAMEKRFAGAVEGRSSTVFVAAFDPERGAGTYVAMESFEGSIDGRRGSFNFVHSATTSGTDRTADWLSIVPGSGTAALASIRGGGAITMGAGGEHRITFDCELD
jgi:hypothetical protein